MIRKRAVTRAVAGGLAASLAISIVLPASAQSDGEPAVAAAPETKGEKRLAKLLEGRVAGEPMQCIRALPSQPMQTIDRTAYVYGSGNTIYVQRTRDPASIDSNDVLVARRFSATALCRLDMINTIDRLQGFFTGAVFFEDFVPYSRVKGDTSGAG